MIFLAETVLKVIEDMEKVEVIFGEVTFGEVIFEVDIIIIQVEIWKIGGHGDNLDHEEKGELGHHPVLDWGSRTSMNRDRIRCFKCREYNHFVNECPNLIPKDSNRESDGVRSIS